MYVSKFTIKKNVVSGSFYYANADVYCQGVAN